jgi:hypothetical protein
MKTLQRLCAAFVLTLALALSAFAGEISTPIAPPPPPQQATQGQIEIGSTAGEITTGLTATDAAMEITLNLLESVLSLF